MLPRPTPRSAAAPHSLSYFLSYDKLLASHRAFSIAITSITKPKFFSQAVKDTKRCEAMAAEVRALEENNTWTPLLHYLFTKETYWMQMNL